MFIYMHTYIHMHIYLCIQKEAMEDKPKKNEIVTYRGKEETGKVLDFSECAVL